MSVPVRVVGVHACVRGGQTLVALGRVACWNALPTGVSALLQQGDLSSRLPWLRLRADHKNHTTLVKDWLGALLCWCSTVKRTGRVCAGSLSSSTGCTPLTL